MVKAIAIFSALLATMASAAVISPAPVNSDNTTPKKRDFYGSGTYFEIGLGACGWWNNDNDAVVAVSAGFYDSNPGICGRQIWVWGFGGKPAQLATIVDRCAGCNYYDIDMSPSLFQNVIGDLGIGRANIGWNWA